MSIFPETIKKFVTRGLNLVLSVWLLKCFLSVGWSGTESTWYAGPLLGLLYQPRMMMMMGVEH
jgi:hypothetical protein